MKRALLAIFVLAVVLGQPHTAGAAPMASTFAMVRSASTTIVIGTVRQRTGSVVVDVDTVIRGSAARGPLTVQQSPDGHITVDNARVVAFIDASGALRWVGELVGGSSIETGVIKLHGFFDFNAHLVRPGVMSLAQLKSALATGALRQTFEATFAFPDGHGGLRTVPSKRFALDYDAFASQILAIRGLALPCLGSPSLFGTVWGSFEVSLSDTCLSNTPTAQKERSLELDGDYTGVSATGAIQVRVVPTRPFMTETEYDAFARDRDVVAVTSVVRVGVPSGPAWSWRVESSLVDPSGHVHDAGGVSSSLEARGTANVSVDTYGFAGGVSITIEPSPAMGSPGGNPRGLVTLVDSGRVTRCSFRHGVKSVPCTLSHAPSIVVRR